MKMRKLPKPKNPSISVQTRKDMIFVIIYYSNVTAVLPGTRGAAGAYAAAAPRVEGKHEPIVRRFSAILHKISS